MRISGPSLTQGGSGKALLECGDVEPNPGPNLGRVPPLTLATLTLLALLMVGLGDLWLWAARPASVWTLAVAEAPLLGDRVQFCQALLALQFAHACRGVQPARAPVLTYPGVQTCQAPALNHTRAQSCQALVANQRARVSRGVQPGQGLGLISTGAQSCQAPALASARAQSCQALMARHCVHDRTGVQPGQVVAQDDRGVQSCQALAGTSPRSRSQALTLTWRGGEGQHQLQLRPALAVHCTGAQSWQAPTLARAGVQSWQTPALTVAGVRSGQAPAPTCTGGCGADRVYRARDAAGLKTLLSGDVHPHPGPLRTAIVNTTSLRLHMDEVTSWDVDVILVQETKLSASGQRVLRGALRQRGWVVFWGAPLETRGRGIWDVPEGGVAVLVRDGHAAEAAKLPKTRQADPLAWDLWLSARFLHVRVAVQTGSTVLHVLCVYGVPGDPELNAGLWDSVLQYAARLGNAPFVVGGDFNFPLGELGALPPVVLGHLLTQRLVDVDAAFATGAGRPLQCSYHRQGVHPGTRIDGVLADPRVAAMVTDVAALPGTGIPGHLPVVFTLAMERAAQRLVRAVRPRPVEVPKRESVLRMELEERLTAPLQPDWDRLLALQEVDALWSYWTWAAEESLLALSVPTLQPEDVDQAHPLPVAPMALPRGRGTAALIREVRQCPKQMRAGGGPKTSVLARIHAAQGAARSLRRQAHPPQRPADRVRGRGESTSHSWCALRRRVQRLHELQMPELARFPLTPQAVANAGAPVPSAAALDECIEQLKRLAATQVQREDRERVQAWRSWLQAEWGTKPGAVYRWLKEEGFSPPVVFIARPDGTPTANVQEMDELVRAAWGPINRKYAEGPEPCPDAFVAKYGHLLYRVPMLAKQLTGPYLRRRLMAMRPSAMGLDGWSLQDLRALPDRVLNWLAQLLTLIEEVGRWPTLLAQGYTSLIPKPGEEGPLGTRPLTVLSMVYRLWAGTRLWEVMRWQESWVHPRAFGFRLARGAVDAATVTQALLELARLKGWRLEGLSLDYVKCFDLIPQAVVLRIARELGMDDGVLRALAAMYRQLRRAFRLAGALGAWWQATNGILQGCPLSVILINILTTVWKMEIDTMRRHVVVATAALPPLLEQPRAAPGQPLPSPRLRTQGPGRADLCPLGYADDTQAITLEPRPGAPGVPDSQAVVDRTAVWLADTGQSANAAKSSSWRMSDQQAQPVTLHGVPIPLAREFKQLGIGVRLDPEKGTGPVLQERFARGTTILRRVGCLPTFRMREVAIGTLALAKAMYGVELADVGSRDVARLELAAVRALWGPTRTSRAKEVLWAVLVPGHRVSPVWRLQYSRVLWLARQARTPGAGQVLVQAILEETDRPPDTGPVGRALQSVRQLRWEAVHGWWVWRVPGQREQLHLVLGDWGEVCHRVRESQRYTALAALERRRPATFGGLGAEVCRPACSQGMTVAGSETERSLLRALQAGATWTGARVQKHHISDLATCPYCGGPPETEVHLLWDCPQWQAQRAAWLPLVQAEAAPLPALALPQAWPVCLRATGLLPAALVQPEGVEQAGRLMYRLYGMYLAVLSARMGAEVAARRDAGAGPSVFAIARRRPPDARRGYPWGQLGAGPHRPAPPAAPLALRAGPPPGWPWEASFAVALLQWAGQLRWLPGPGHVTYVELALDFEAHAERALPAPSDHRLRGVTLPLRTRGQVLKMALDALQPHLQAGDLMHGKEVWMAKSLLPLGGFRCVGRSARPLFARPEAMLFQMRQLEAHCRALWARRLARPGAGRQDVFLLDYLPPAGPGQQPLRPFQRLPRRRVQRDRRGAGGGDADREAPPPQVALCARHRAPPCAACVQRGAEHCCQRAHEGHRMDAAQARVAARALRAWLQPARPAGAGPVAASQAARGSPSARKRPRARSSSPERETRRARPEHEHARRQEEFPPPPPKRLQGGGTQLKRLRYVKPAGRAQEALPALPAPPSGSHRARGGTRSPSATRASRTPGRTRTGGGGSAASPPPLPPLPGAGGHFRGHLTPADGGTGGVISQRGGRRPPPGGREPPPRGGAGSGGFGRTPP